MKFIKIFFSCFLLTFPFVTCRDANVISMIISFLTSDIRPALLLTPGLCWTPRQFNTLARALSTNSISTAASLQQGRHEYHLHHVVILVDLSCSDAYGFLVNASVSGYMKSPYRWLILTEGPGVFEDVQALVDSEVVVARRRGDEFLLSEVYKISEQSNIIELPRGHWYGSKNSAFKEPNTKLKIAKAIQVLSTDDSNDSDMILKDEDNLANLVTGNGALKDLRKSTVVSSRRHNLAKHVLTMVNVITDSNETKNHLDDRLNLHHDSITKMSAMVVSVCFEMLNATERRIFTPTWGYRDANGNWQQGIVSHLMKKEADLGTLTIFTQERLEIIDYIAMVGSTAVRFVFREPPLAYVSNIFALPFTTGVWCAILICVLGCSVFLYVTSKWEASMGMHPLQLDGSWADVLILIIGAVLQQGCTLEPRYAAGRIVTVFVFLCLTILYAAYSANIVVLLRAPSSSIRNLPDLLRAPIKVGASDFEYNRYFFKKLNDPIRKAIYDKKIAPKGKKPNFYSMNEGIAKIRQGLFAFHMEVNPGYRLIQDTFMEDEKCDLVEIDFINEIDPWVPGQKGSPYNELFKINFLKIRESGVQQCIHRRLHVPRPRCSAASVTFSSVGLRDVGPALLGTLYGFLMAPLLLLLEIVYWKLLHMRQKEREKMRNEPKIAFMH